MGLAAATTTLRGADRALSVVSPLAAMNVASSSVCAPPDMAGSRPLQGKPAPAGAAPHVTPSTMERLPSTKMA